MLLPLFATLLFASNAIGAILPVTHHQLESRKVLGPFTVNSTGEVQARLGIEHHGLGKVLATEHRPIDYFLLNGNILIAEDRNDSCYVNPETDHLHCEDVPENVPHSATKFGMSSKGFLTFNGTENWWLCPAENPQTYNVYLDKTPQKKKPSPYCKATQLKMNPEKNGKRSDNKAIETRDNMQYCPFVLSLVSNVLDGNNAKDSAFGPFIISGRSLMTSRDFVDYCFVDAISRKLLCEPKSSSSLMSNWHSIDFAFSKDNTIEHNGSDTWYICENSKGGLVGPFDSEKKNADTECSTKLRAVQLKAQYPSKVKQCHNASWSPKNTQSLQQLFHQDVLKPARHESELKQRAPVCPLNLVNTLFKSPSHVVPVALCNNTKLPGNAEKIVILPTQSAAVNFFIPFTSPYYGKTCSLLFLIPYAHELSVSHQSTAPAVQVSILDRPVEESTTFGTLPKGRVLTNRILAKDIKTGQDNSLVTFPCEAGTTMTFLLASKGGLSLIVRQGGVPNESGLHVVPCV